MPVENVENKKPVVKKKVVKKPTLAEQAKEINALKREIRKLKKANNNGQEELKAAMKVADDNFKYAEASNKKAEEINELLVKERQKRNTIIEDIVTTFDQFESTMRMNRKAIERDLKHDGN